MADINGEVEKEVMPKLVKEKQPNYAMRYSKTSLSIQKMQERLDSLKKNQSGA